MECNCVFQKQNLDIWTPLGTLDVVKTEIQKTLSDLPPMVPRKWTPLGTLDMTKTSMQKTLGDNPPMVQGRLSQCISLFWDFCDIGDENQLR